MRLFEINFENHHFFKKQKIDFVKPIENTPGTYTTVIIGPNGTGKSLLLREIIRIFKDLRGRKGGAYQKRVLEYKSTIRFFADHVLNEVIEDNGMRQYFVDGKKANLYDWHFPKRIIAISSLFNDKFIFSKGDGFYKYAGTRSSNNNAGTKSIIKQMVGSLATCDYERIKTLNHVLSELNFEKYFSIVYEFRYIHTVSKFSSIDAMNNFFINWKERSTRKTTPFSYNNYLNLSDDTKYKILSFLNKNIKNDKYIEYNIMDHDRFIQFVEDYEMLIYLTKLDLITSPEIVFHKNDYLSDANISSGEYSLIFQFLRIMINIEDDSLVLIDEPETSLHPNWQVKYLNILYKVLSMYQEIHIILATHSHLIVTNLNPDLSNIIKVTNENQYIPIEYNISGWSPENILYNVFGITSFRNYYFELDVRKLVKYLESGECVKGDIENILIRLNSFSIEENDPLKLLINEVKERIYDERNN